MKDLILKALSMPYIHYVDDIKHKTKLSKEVILNTLNELINEDLVYKANTCYYLKKKGIIQIKDKGFGFINVSEEEKDYHVDEDSTKGASTGDLVSFYVLPSVSDEFLDSAIVIDILERKNKKVYGKLILKKSKKKTEYYVMSHDSDYNVKCFIDEKDLLDAVPGSICVCDILKYDSNRVVHGKIERVVGYEDDPGVDIKLIALKHNFETDFPEDVIEEIKSIPSSIKKEDYKDRKDFTDKLIITIDGDDSKDFDDAVSVEILPNGNYLLGVYIADVSEYVKSNSPLDREAYKRGTSCYLADRVIPMLPHKLSNGICSLNEGELRLCEACIMELVKKGNLINYYLTEGIIKSCHRMTYNNVNKILNGDKELMDKYLDIYHMLLHMKELSDIIRYRREKKGAIEFDTPEYKITLDEKGDPIDFKLRVRDKAEMMIEDFMLEANETVAYHLSISNLPGIFRVHEKPESERISKVFELMNNLGFKVSMPKNKIMASDIQRSMNMVEHSDYKMVINQMMLRAMMKAKYSEKNLGHYALAMTYYCHFTSPIRRYPDLICHRIIKSLIFHPSNFDEKLAYFEANLHEMANYSSIREREAIDCEREVDDYLMAKYMENHIYEHFEGIIDSITGFGMFVLLDNGIEGLIHISNLIGYYTYNEKYVTLESTRHLFKIGDKIKIVVISSSIKDRKIDFMLEDDFNETYGGFHD